MTCTFILYTYKIDSRLIFLTRLSGPCKNQRYIFFLCYVRESNPRHTVGKANRNQPYLLRAKTDGEEKNTRPTELQTKPKYVSMNWSIHYTLAFHWWWYEDVVITTHVITSSVEQMKSMWKFWLLLGYKKLQILLGLHSYYYFNLEASILYFLAGVLLFCPKKSLGTIPPWAVESFWNGQSGPRILIHDIIAYLADND